MEGKPHGYDFVRLERTSLPTLYVSRDGQSYTVRARPDAVQSFLRAGDVIAPGNREDGSMQRCATVWRKSGSVWVAAESIVLLSEFEPADRPIGRPRIVHSFAVR